MPRWLFHTLLTLLLWGAWGVVSKQLSSGLAAWDVQAWSTIGMLPVLLWLGFAVAREKRAWSWRGGAQAFVAGVLVSLGNVACFQAMALGGKAAAVIPLTALYPLVTILLSLAVLHERLNAFQAAGLLLALAAMWLLNVGPGSGWLSGWIGVALVPIALWGVSAFLQKLSTASLSAQQSALAFLLGFLPFAVASLAMRPLPQNLTAPTCLQLALLGLLFALGNLTLLHAYASGGKAAVVTPMASLYSMVTVLGAVAVLGERASPAEWLGVGFAVAAAAALSMESPSAAPGV